MRLPFISNLVTKVSPEEVRHSTAGVSELFAPNTRYDYSRETNAIDNSAVAAGVGWFARTFSEAPIAVYREEDTALEIQPGHPLTDLVRHPNAHYAGITLMNTTIQEFILSGNAYWLIVRDPRGMPTELWLLPSSSVEPRRPNDGSAVISHYEYSPGQTTIRLDPLDVVHFRDGINPTNTTKGRSRLAASLREIWTDNEASNFTASLLRNFAVPGVIFSPEDGNVGFDKDARDSIRRNFSQAFGRDKRGSVMVGSGKKKIDVVSFSPDQMDMELIRAIPGSRVAAALGIPAALIGYLVGIKQTAVGATLAELRELGYESGIIPVQRQISEQLDLQLLPQMGALAGEEVGFDIRHVRVLQEDADTLSVRTLAQVTNGTLKVTDAQRILGLPVDETQDGYLRNAMTTMLVRSGEDPQATGDDDDVETRAAALQDFPELKLLNTAENGG